MSTPTKNRKLSGLKGIKFTEALDCVLRLKRLLEDCPDEPEDDGDAFERAGEAGELIERLSNIMTTSALCRSLTCSRSTASLPGHLNVQPDDLLIIPEKQATEAVSRSLNVAARSLWSSARTQEHLDFLFQTVPLSSEAANRLLIDTVFFRAAALMPLGHSLLLHLEAPIPPTTRPEDTTSLSGIVDYLALMVPTDKLYAWRSVESFYLLKALKPSGLFVAEAKHGADLQNHLPQAISEQYACAVQLGKSTMRGVLTNGIEWIFTIVYVNVSELRARYRWSQTFDINEGGKTTPRANPCQVELVALALAQSIQNCSIDIQPDELFESFR